MPAPKGFRPPGGSRKGIPNKATAALKDIAQQYTSEAVAALAAVMRDEKAPHQARVAASTALLDRGHGKPSQAIQHSGPDGEALIPAEPDPRRVALAVVAVIEAAKRQESGSGE